MLTGRQSCALHPKAAMPRPPSQPIGSPDYIIVCTVLHCDPGRAGLFHFTTAKEVQAHRADGGFLQHVASIPYTLQSWQGLRTRRASLGQGICCCIEKPLSTANDRQGKVRCIPEDGL